MHGQWIHGAVCVLATVALAAPTAAEDPKAYPGIMCIPASSGFGWNVSPNEAGIVNAVAVSGSNGEDYLCPIVRETFNEASPKDVIPDVQVQISDDRLCDGPEHGHEAKCWIESYHLNLVADAATEAVAAQDTRCIGPCVNGSCPVDPEADNSGDFVIDLKDQGAILDGLAAWGYLTVRCTLWEGYQVDWVYVEEHDDL